MSATSIQLPLYDLRTGYTRSEVGTIPQDWNVVCLADICSMKSGFAITANSLNDHSPYPCYGGNGLRGYTSRFTHEGKYALIGRQGALCGNVVGVEGKFFASEHAVVVTAKPGTDPGWLTRVLSSMALNRYSESSAQPGLSVQKLLALRVSFPPEEVEQRAIAEALGDMDALIAALQKLIAKKRAIKTATMQRLLTGKQRLPGFGAGSGYQPTEIGVIPEDWSLFALGDLGQIVTGSTPPTRDQRNYGNEHLFVGPADIGENKYICSTHKRLSAQGFEMARQFPIGSILFVCIGSIGKCAIASKVLTANQQINAIFPSRAFDTDFLYYMLSWRSEQIRQTASTQVLPLISKSHFSVIMVGLPTLEEQHVIGRILTDMDAEITALEKRLAKTRDIKQGMMQELLTGRTRLV